MAVDNILVLIPREHPSSRKREHAISGTFIPKQWLTAENGRQGEATIMVKTRENTPHVRTLRSGNGRGKNIGNREEKVSTNGWISSSLMVTQLVVIICTVKAHMQACVAFAERKPQINSLYSFFLFARLHQAMKVDPRQNLFPQRSAVCVTARSIMLTLAYIPDLRPMFR